MGGSRRAVTYFVVVENVGALELGSETRSFVFGCILDMGQCVLEGCEQGRVYVRRGKVKTHHTHQKTQKQCVLCCRRRHSCLG